MNTYKPLDFTKLKPGEYTRKSSESEDKQMLSIVSQREKIQRIAHYYKLPKFVKSFIEAKSAKKENERPEFNELIRMIKAGLVDAIVCWKLDRLARNMTEGGILIDLLSSGTLKAIITHDKVYYPTDNVLLMSVEFGQGKQFVKDLSVNVKRGQTKKASMGIPHGVATLGFLNDRSEEKGNRKWLVDTTRLETINILLKTFLTGTYSAGKLYKYATGTLNLTTVKRKRIGGEPITLSRIYEILTDPIYAGFFFYNNERYELDPALPRLITEDEHHKIKNLLSRKNIPKTQHHEATYVGFIADENGKYMGPDVHYQVICDCKHKFAYRQKTHCPKCNIRIDQMQNPKYLDYKRYYSVAKKKNGLQYATISENLLDEKLIDFFSKNLEIPGPLLEWSKKYIHEMRDDEVAKKILLDKRQTERQVEFSEKKYKLRSLLRDGKIEDSDYKEDLKRLEKEYGNMSTSDTNSLNWFDRMMEITDLSSGLSRVFQNGEIKAKRNILSRLGSNLVWNDKEVLIINKKSIQVLIDGIKSIKPIIEKFEPKLFLTNKGLNEKTSELSPVFSTMLCG